MAGHSRRSPSPADPDRPLDHLDTHCRNFIALSPFSVISSARADGRADASPRGDPPGALAYVLDGPRFAQPIPARNPLLCAAWTGLPCALATTSPCRRCQTSSPGRQTTIHREPLFAA